MSVIEQLLGSIFNFYVNFGSSDYIGENLTQIEHMTEAAMLAEFGNLDVWPAKFEFSEDKDYEMILAAFFHDIGHLLVLNKFDSKSMNGYGIVDHEKIGYDFLKTRGFSDRLCKLVYSHVFTKRYMATKYGDDYMNNLSDASKYTFNEQGRYISESELKDYEQDPLIKDYIKLRYYDDASKIANVDILPIEYYKDMTRDYLEKEFSKLIDKSDITFFKENGYLHIKNFYNTNEHDIIEGLTNILEQWPDSYGKWMKYYEKDDQLSRMENFLDYDPELNKFLNSVKINYVLEQLFKNDDSETGVGVPGDFEPGHVLFKEKINFKYPGGGAFKAHQDEPAFSMFDHKYHITVCIPVDNATIENGCLEISPGNYIGNTVPQDVDKTIHPDYENKLEWIPIELNKGDVLLFDSFIPHRSKDNHSTKSRRAYFITYNKKIYGDHRKEYYKMKRQYIPPENEKIPGKEYPFNPAFNVGNPFNVTS